MNHLVTSLMNIVSSYEGILRILLAIILFVIVLVIRKNITKALSKWVYKLLKVRLDEQRLEEIESYQKPLQWMFIVLASQIIGHYVLPLSIQVLFFKIPFSTIYLVLFGLGAGNFIDALSKKHWDKSEAMNQTLLHLSFKVAKFLLWAVIAVMILDQFGYNINGLLAGLGLGGLAVALAAQDTVSNLFGCVIIVLDKPFEINDWIQTPDVEGIVEEISFRSTRVRTFQNALVSIPNSTLSSSIITNWSRMEKRKLRFYVNLTYSTTKEQLQNVAREIREYLDSQKDIEKGSAMVFFEEMSSSSLDLRVDCIILKSALKDFLTVREKINYAVMDIVNKEGAGFAFPSQSIYIESMPK